MPTKEKVTDAVSSRTRTGVRRDRSVEGRTPTSESAHETRDDRTSTVSTSRRNGPHQARFRSSVLEPRGIRLQDQKPKAKPPEAHFHSTLPCSGSYVTAPECAHAGIWVSLDTMRCEAISKHYSFMEKMRLSEDQFATYAKQNLFRCEEWELNLPHDRLWRGERIDTFVNPADPAELWLAPPLLLTQQAVDAGYSWDVRPDCAYWLSNRGFNEEYADAIPGCCFVYRNWISNPYLTIEFKKNDWKPGVAATQLLTASAIALYNRCELGIQAKRDIGASEDLRHYGMTFEGSQFVVYVVRPTNPVLDQRAPRSGKPPADRRGSSPDDRYPDQAGHECPQWHGCEMRRLAQGDCTIARDIRRLIGWINEIHRWGITAHAQSVQEDIKICLAEEGINTSALHDTDRE